MKFSAFGNKFTNETGISTLMEDLGTALREKPEMIFMGGGNPAHIEPLEVIFQQQLEAILENPAKRHELFGVYQSPLGDLSLRTHLAKTLHNHYGWPISANNIAISNGSQSAFYTLFNLFGGPETNDSGPVKQIQLPLAPEYLGYSDAGLQEDFFDVTRPSIEFLDNHQFKYHVDFNALKITNRTGALCVSRPSNPTGNVLTDEEIDHLQALTLAKDIPLIVDGAYGAPFPNIIFSNIVPSWTPNTVLTLSLSKLGLPGVRTGIVIAREDIIEAFGRANTVLSLAPGNTGPMLLEQLLKDDLILKLGNQYIKPFYKDRLDQVLAMCQKHLGQLNYRVHKPEGAIFLWLWFKDLPIHSQELYKRLKDKGVLVVPGHHFFMGLEHTDWAHSRECLRMTYTQPLELIDKGLAIIAKEVSALYEHGKQSEETI